MPTETRNEVNGCLTIEDLARYQYYHSLRRTWPFVVVMVTVAATALVAIPFILIDDFSDWRPVITNAVPFTLLVFFWLALLLVLPYINARRQYAAQSYLRESTAYAFTAHGIEVRGENVSSTMAWNTVREVRETTTLFLIYHALNIAIVIPKRFFSSPDLIDAWKRDAERNIGKPITSSGVMARLC